jgi:hypothetical protein
LAPFTAILVSLETEALSALLRLPAPFAEFLG